MAYDHYFSQTALKHWGDPQNKNLLQAYRKSDLAQFPCRTKDVCGEEDGDLNPKYLTEPNLLGQWRKVFEPHWNKAVALLQDRRLDGDHKFVLAAGWSSFATTTPKTIEHGQKIYEHELRAMIPLIAKKPPPGPVSIEIDRDFIRAVITKNLERGAWFFANLDWIVLLNDTPTPFLTSDNPSAILPPLTLGGLSSRILPISPRCVILAGMDMRVKVLPVDYKKPLQGTVSYYRPLHELVKEVNRLTVRHATDLVFSQQKDAGIAALVKKYRHFDVQVMMQEKKIPNGAFVGAGLRIAEKEPSAT